MSHLDSSVTCSTPLLGGQSGSKVSRLTEGSGETKIIKTTRREDMPDYLTANYPSVDMAEYLFYTELQPKLDLPAPSLLGHGHLPQGGVFLVLEDVAKSHRLLPLGHHYTTLELLSIIATYARLHGRGQRIAAADKAYSWLHQDPRTTLAAHLVLRHLQELARNEWTNALAAVPLYSPRLPSLLREVAARLAHLPSTILHNDFYATNVALPLDCTQPAVLLDWQLIGRGPLQLDLANIGLLSASPCFKEVDKDAVLLGYLEALAREGGPKITLRALREQYTYAELLLALDFLPRFVRAMHRANDLNEPWIPWMRDAYATNMANIAVHL
ncbi:MAG: phosphotransferase [Firmicutes bacterium]|nr:phosphotransferase [Dethiobacter sp.]MBS3889623.1 phosphotransferase [Bacillota bacterium]